MDSRARRPRLDWRIVAALACIAAVSAACDSDDGPPTVMIGDGGRESIDRLLVGTETLARCGTSERRVKVDLVGGQDVDAIVDCDVLRAVGPSGVTSFLLAESKSLNDSAVKAARVEALQREVEIGSVYQYADVAWSLAAGEGLTCARARDAEAVRSNLAVGMENGETAAEWTTVEAVFDAGVCPENLDALYRNVAAAGYPEAAETVRRQIEEAADAAQVPL